MQVTACFYQERGKDIHAVVDIEFYQGDEYAGATQKICRNLERLPLTPQLLHYELSNGFPSFSPFDSKDFGGYTHSEIIDQLANSAWKEIAHIRMDEYCAYICCNFDLMNEGIRKLLQETIRIIEAEAKASGKEFAVEE